MKIKIHSLEEFFEQLTKTFVNSTKLEMKFKKFDRKGKYLHWQKYLDEQFILF